MSSPVEMPPLILLCGGKGTRLGELAKDKPKSLVEVAGKPFIEHQLRLLAREGIKDLIVCAGYKSGEIERFLGNGSDFGFRVIYSIERDQLLGTGGAVQRAVPLVGNYFWVLYGDSYLDIPFRPILDFFLAKEKNVMTVFRNRNQWDKSNVCFKNGQITAYQKDNNSADFEYIDYGLSLLRHSAFDSRSQTQVFDLAQTYERLAQNGELLGFEVQKRFYEIGSPQGLKETEEYLRSHQLK